MKTRSIALWLMWVVAAYPTAADEPPPVVIPAGTGDGKAATAKFGSGYLTRDSAGNCYTTSRFGSGWITRGPEGKTWVTSKFGSGAITRGPDGESITTTKFGSGYLSRSRAGDSFTTTKFGSGWITRGPGGSSVTTTQAGDSHKAGVGENRKGATILVLPAPAPARRQPATKK